MMQVTIVGTVNAHQLIQEIRDGAGFDPLRKISLKGDKLKIAGVDDPVLEGIITDIINAHVPNPAFDNTAIRAEELTPDMSMLPLPPEMRT